MNDAFASYLRERANSRARSHGNYLPALDKATQLLEDSRQDAQLFVLFLSDGAPSDQTGMPCSHGIYVWKNDTSVRPDGTGKHPLRRCEASEKPQSCQWEVQRELKKACCDRVKQLGVRFGRERTVFATVAFGDPKGNYSMLQQMSRMLPRGSFSKLGVNLSALRTTMSSLSASLTSMRTEAAGGSAMTLRDVQVGAESNDEHRARLDVVAGDGWHVFLDVTKLEYSVEHECLREVPMSEVPIGIAFRTTPFAQGAERFAHRGSELAYSPSQEIAKSSRVVVTHLRSRTHLNGVGACVVGRKGEQWLVKLDTKGEDDPAGEEVALDPANLRNAPRLVRSGHWLVTKLSRYEQLLHDRSFHETFCRMHEEAFALATRFNERLHGNSMSAFSIRFIRCSVYEGVNTQGTRMSILAEQELEGDYLKYNNNAGKVRTAITQTPAPISGPESRLGVILEEDEDEAAAEPAAIEAPQCFSHFSFVESCCEKLVCDLQGTWNPTDGYLFTDPVVHHINLEKHSNGATDKGLQGIEKFFESHTCGPLCARLRLPSPSKCITLAGEKLESLRRQKEEEEQKRQEEEWKRQEEERKRQEEQALQELARQQEEQQKRRDDEARRLEEARRQQMEEQHQRDLERQRLLKERQQQEQQWIEKQRQEARERQRQRQLWRQQQESWSPDDNDKVSRAFATFFILYLVVILLCSLAKTLPALPR